LLFHTVKHPILKPDLKELDIIPLGDIHIGDPMFQDKLFNDKVYEIKHRPNALVILKGDCINNGIKSSVSNCYEETMKPKEQRKYLVELLKPIKNKIIGAIEGNHERRTTKEVDCSPTEVYAAELGCQYFGNEVLLKISFGKSGAEGDTIHYTYYGTHGWGGGRKEGGKINNLISLGEIVIADVYCMAHTHIKADIPGVIFIPNINTNRINKQPKRFVMSGSWLDRGGYAAMYGFKPVEIGSPTITLNGKRKEISVTI
jgi:predicted MPP superfamily phosphohydrolase